MNLRKKIFYSIAPLVVILLLFLHFFTLEGILNIYTFAFVNVMLIIQTILLYLEMGELNMTSEKKSLYTLILISFLPFHFILVWILLDKKNNE